MGRGDGGGLYEMLYFPHCFVLCNFWMLGLLVFGVALLMFLVVARLRREHVC